MSYSEGSISLKIYREAVLNIPSLTIDQEEELLSQIQKGNDEARKKLAEAYLALVLEIIDEKVSSLTLDLIQEGNVGLFSAIQKYESKSRLPFKDFVHRHIKEAVDNAVEKMKE